MFTLPIHRNNYDWVKINSQFLKGGFNWYNQGNPSCKNWYYFYYISEGEKRLAKNMATFRKTRHSKVTTWLRNIEKYEEIHKNIKKKEKKNGIVRVGNGEKKIV